MKKPTKKRRSSAEVNRLQKIMVEIKPKLPRGSISKLVALFPKKYNSYKAGEKVRLVYGLKMVDEKIINDFQNLLEIYEAEKEKGNIKITKDAQKES